MRVIVVGAGVIGTSIAYRLAAASADVTLLDAGQPGGATTSRSFAWLNGNDKQPPAYGQLNAEGIAVRSGHHCAQPILRRFGYETTVRPSFAFYNTCAEIDVLVDAVKKLATAR